MARRVYVGNLPLDVSEATIRDLFSEFGEVHSVQIISDRDTGRPRGFGFVEMENADEALLALDGHDVQGRHIKVALATERGPGSGTGGRAPPESQLGPHGSGGGIDD